MSLNNFEPNRHRPGQLDRRGQGHQTQSGDLAASSPNEPGHSYESLKRGTNKVDQDSEYEHYMDIVS